MARVNQITAKKTLHGAIFAGEIKVKNNNNNHKYLIPYLIIKLMSKAIRVV